MPRRHRRSRRDHHERTRPSRTDSPRRQRASKSRQSYERNFAFSAANNVLQNNTQQRHRRKVNSRERHNENKKDRRIGKQKRSSGNREASPVVSKVKPTPDAEPRLRSQTQMSREKHANTHQNKQQRHRQVYMANSREDRKDNRETRRTGKQTWKSEKIQPLVSETKPNPDVERLRSQTRRSREKHTNTHQHNQKAGKTKSRDGNKVNTQADGAVSRQTGEQNQASGMTPPNISQTTFPAKVDRRGARTRQDKQKRHMTPQQSQKQQKRRQQPDRSNSHGDNKENIEEERPTPSPDVGTTNKLTPERERMRKEEQRKREMDAEKDRMKIQHCLCPQNIINEAEEDLGVEFP